MRFSLFTVAVILLSVFNAPLSAQEVGLCYDAELQMTPKGVMNFANRLYLSAGYALNDQFELCATTLSLVKTREERLMNDLQVFSNIDADDLTLGLTVAGLGWTPDDRHYLFAGIRTVNEDYFISPVTSLFINSSCGIFPTIAYNLPIANFPVASMGIHYSYTLPSFQFLASLYNGLGYDRLTGRNNVWRVTPQSDGLFMITQGEWTLGQGHYFLGSCLHTGTPEDASAKSMLWTYTEQALSERLSLIADYSHAFGRGCECTDFVGIGLQYAAGPSTWGIFSDYARFRNDKEKATELTFRRELSSKVFVQASYHLIHQDRWQTAGLVRLGVRL